MCRCFLSLPSPIFTHLGAQKENSALCMSELQWAWLGFLFGVQQGQKQGFVRDWTFCAASSSESTSGTIQMLTASISFSWLPRALSMSHLVHSIPKKENINSR